MKLSLVILMIVAALFVIGFMFSLHIGAGVITTLIAWIASMLCPADETTASKQ